MPQSCRVAAIFKSSRSRAPRPWYFFRCIKNHLRRPLYLAHMCAVAAVALRHLARRLRGYLPQNHDGSGPDGFSCAYSAAIPSQSVVPVPRYRKHPSCLIPSGRESHLESALLRNPAAAHSALNLLRGHPNQLLAEHAKFLCREPRPPFSCMPRLIHIVHCLAGCNQCLDLMLFKNIFRNVYNSFFYQPIDDRRDLPVIDAPVC